MRWFVLTALLVGVVVGAWWVLFGVRPLSATDNLGTWARAVELGLGAGLLILATGLIRYDLARRG